MRGGQLTCFGSEIICGRSHQSERIFILELVGAYFAINSVHTLSNVKLPDKTIK